MPTKTTRPRRFFFHYNKPLAQQRGYPMLSVHIGDKCHFVKAVVCNVPIQSKNNKRQPRCVMVGSAKKFRIIDDVAHID